MYSFLTSNTAVNSPISAVIKSEAHYNFFTYTGARAVNLEFRGQPVPIKNGDVFGVRPSSNKKHIRLIRRNDPNRVITLSVEQASKLAKNVRRVK